MSQMSCKMSQMPCKTSQIPWKMSQMPSKTSYLRRQILDVFLHLMAIGCDWPHVQKTTKIQNTYVANLMTIGRFWRQHKVSINKVFWSTLPDDERPPNRFQVINGCQKLAFDSYILIRMPMPYPPKCDGGLKLLVCINKNYKLQSIIILFYYKPGYLTFVIITMITKQLSNCIAVCRNVSTFLIHLR